MNSLDNQIENQIDNIIDATTANINIDSVDDTKSHISSDHGSNFSDLNNNQVEDDGEYSEIDEESTQAFNISLQQYLALDSEKEALMSAMRERNSQKKTYEQSMLTYLQRYNIDNIRLDGSYKNKMIETEVKITTTGFSRRIVVEVLQECIGHDSELFDKVMSKLQEKMKQNEVCKLKLIDLSKKRKTKKDMIKSANENIDNILENSESAIPENMKYLYENDD
jgi:hypothetical protein